MKAPGCSAAGSGGGKPQQAEQIALIEAIGSSQGSGGLQRDAFHAGLPVLPNLSCCSGPGSLEQRRAGSRDAL